MSRHLSCGIVGLPNVGKSTFFNALTKAKAASSNYPFCTIEPNVGIVEVYDSRLKDLARISHSKAILYATMEFVDIAGLVKGASQGEGLGNQFLTHIRETDAILHIVRCFEDENIIHVGGGLNPIGDAETINYELLLADLQSVEGILGRLEKQAKSKKDLAETVAVLKKVYDHLSKGFSVRTLSLSDQERVLLMPYPLLTSKKMVYVANVSEKDLPHMENAHVAKLREYAKKEGVEVLTISAQIEAELADLVGEEQTNFLESLGLKETGLNRVIQYAFSMLGLISFLTTGEMETRAWTIPRGITAYEAAAKIHTDIQKKFVRAEVISYEDFVKYGGRAGAKEAGKLRIEGKDYIVKDGDVILFMV